MDRNPRKTAGRRARRYQRLGPDAWCRWCGEGSPETLREVASPEIADRLHGALLERHHVLGCAYDSDLTLILCLNCHALATEDQLRLEVPLEPSDNTLDRLIACGRGLSAFLQSSQYAVERRNRELEALRTFLDSNFPTWRDQWKSRP